MLFSKLWTALMEAIFQKLPNGPIKLIPVPSGVLARRLRGRLGRQTQARIPHRGH